MSRVFALLALTAIPIMLASQPDWCSRLDKHVLTSAVANPTSVVPSCFVKRFNASADGKRLLFVWRGGGGTSCRVGVTGAGQPDDWMPIDALEEPIDAATISHDGSHVLLGTSQGRLEWADLATGIAFTLNESVPGFAFTATALSHDQRRIAAADNSGRVLLGGPCTETMKLIMPAAMSPGRTCATDLRFSADGQRLIAARTDGSVIAWECTTGNLLQAISAHRGPVTGAAFLAGNQRIISSGIDGSVRTWDLVTGREGRPLESAGSQILSLAIAPNGDMVAWGTVEGTACLRTVEGCSADSKIHSLGAPVRYLEFSADGQVLRVAGCQSVIRQFDIATGVELPCLDLGIDPTGADGSIP